MKKTYYMYEVHQPTATNDLQIIQIGNKKIEIDFQWAIVSAEQLGHILNRFAILANTDPIYRKDGSIDRDYSYVEYYYNLRNEDLRAWLATGPELPRSIRDLPVDQQISILQDRIKTCVGMMPIIQQYIEVLRWQATVTYNNEITVAVVQPGGWFRNQDNSFSFRFLSTLDYIGLEDLGTVVIQFEVYDE